MAGAAAIEPGVILYPKPSGVTSHDCVARVRRALPRGTKVGHAGTLDPFASGLLLVLVGAATRTQRWLMGLPKTYLATARLGWRSDTGDRDGELEQTGRMPASLEIPVGEAMQRPPAYSAVKVGGERLYEKARRGEAQEGSPRPIAVYRADLLWHRGDRAAFEIECSAGTYIRQLVADLGDAYCEELERTAIGSFRMADADPSTVVPLLEALSFVRRREVSADEQTALRQGRRIPPGQVEPAPASRDGGIPEPRELLAVGGGRPIAIVEAQGDELRPVVVFPS